MDSPQSISRFDNESWAQSSALDVLRQTYRNPSGLSFGLLEGRRGIDADTVNCQLLGGYYRLGINQYLLYLHFPVKAYPELHLHVQ